jgi:hypothetical protein
MLDTKYLARLSAPGIALLLLTVGARADDIKIITATPTLVAPGQTLTVALEVDHTGAPTVTFPCPLTLTLNGASTPVVTEQVTVPPALYKITIPSTAPDGTYTLSWTCANGISATGPSPITIGGVPVVSGFAPSPAPSGSDQTITGSYFGDTPGDIYFVSTQNAQNAYALKSVTSWSSTSITYTLPILAPGTYTLMVQSNGNGNSAAVPITIVAPELQGWVDLHTHPLANLGFGGKLYYGNVDFDATNGTGTNGSNGGPCAPTPVLVNSLQLALGPENWVQGGYDSSSNPCGDVVGWPVASVRYQVVEQTENQNHANIYTNSTFTTSGYQGKESADPPVQDFPTWPAWDDITHQKMYVDWIQRAYQGGLRVLVALAVNSKTLGDMTSGGSGMPGQRDLPANNAAIPTCTAQPICAPVQPADWPTDDKTSADLQIQEIKNFVGRHSDFMEVALSSADIKRIVSENKLAVVVGVEIDNIGNYGVVGVDPGTNRILEGGFPETDAALGAIAGGTTTAVVGATTGGVFGFLFGGPAGAVVGVLAGGTSGAVAGAITGAAAGALAGATSPYEVGQVNTGANVMPTPPELLVAEVDRLYNEGVRYIFPIHLVDNPTGGTATYLDLFNWANVYEEGHAWSLTCAKVSDNVCYQYNSNNTSTPSLTSSNATSQLEALGEQLKLGFIVQVPPPLACTTANPACTGGTVGNMNTVGLNPAGQCAIQEMMSKGMLIDIDHMSDAAAEQTITLAKQQGIGYPLNSGHNQVRNQAGVTGAIWSERNLTAAHYQAIGALHGMAGVGSVGLDACQWLNLYTGVVEAMGMDENSGNVLGPEIIAGFGTDQVLAAGMKARLSTTSYAAPTSADGATYSAYLACMNKCDAVGGACYSGSTTGTSTAPNKTTGPIATGATGVAEQAGLSACHVCTAACLAADGIKTYSPNCNGAYVVSNVKYDNSIPLTVAGVENNSGIPMSSLGNQTWNYNTAGVAHYGMLPDFLADVATLPATTTGGPTGANVVAQMQSGAQYFYQTWRIAENVSAGVKVPSSCTQASVSTTTPCPAGESRQDCGSSGSICVANGTCPRPIAQCPPGEQSKSCGIGTTLCSNPASATTPICP